MGQILSGLILIVFVTGCAGIPMPFTDARLGAWPIESSRKDENATCIDLPTLQIVGDHLEQVHLTYLRNEGAALEMEHLLSALGEKCRIRFSRLSLPQIKTELYGDIQTIEHSSKLRESGGVEFLYKNV